MFRWIGVWRPAALTSSWILCRWRCSRRTWRPGSWWWRGARPGRSRDCTSPSISEGQEHTECKGLIKCCISQTQLTKPLESDHKSMVLKDRSRLTCWFWIKASRWGSHGTVKTTRTRPSPMTSLESCTWTRERERKWFRVSCFIGMTSTRTSTGNRGALTSPIAP